VCFLVDGIHQYWLLGEEHTPKDRVFPNKLDLHLSNGELTFMGSNRHVMSAPRFLYAMAAASKRKQVQIDIFAELPYIEQSLIHPDTITYYDEYANLDLNIIGAVFQHMGCGSLIPEQKSKCDVHPYCRFHIADYRIMHATKAVLNDITLAMVLHQACGTVRTRIIENPTNKEPFIKYAEAIQQFARDLGPDWNKREFLISFTSDYFIRDRWEMISEAVQSFQARVAPISEMEDITPLFQRLAQRVTSTRVHGAHNHKYDRYLVHESRKQFLKLQQESPDLAAKVMEFIQTKQQWPDLSFLEEFGAIAVKDLESEAFNENLRYEFILTDSIYMDAPLICRMLRSFGNGSSAIKIAYTGAAHTRSLFLFLQHIYPNSGVYTNGVPELYKYEREATVLEPYLQMYSTAFMA
jgi:hypothetical protein